MNSCGPCLWDGNQEQLVSCLVVFTELTDLRVVVGPNPSCRVQGASGATRPAGKAAHIKKRFLATKRPMHATTVQQQRVFLCGAGRQPIFFHALVCCWAKDDRPTLLARRVIISTRSLPSDTHGWPRLVCCTFAPGAISKLGLLQQGHGPAGRRHTKWRSPPSSL